MGPRPPESIIERSATPPAGVAPRSRAIRTSSVPERCVAIERIRVKDAGWDEPSPVELRTTTACPSASSQLGPAVRPLPRSPRSTRRVARRPLSSAQDRAWSDVHDLTARRLARRADAARRCRVLLGGLPINAKLRRPRPMSG
jgi:hypothetical protein